MKIGKMIIWVCVAVMALLLITDPRWEYVFGTACLVFCAVTY